MKYLGFILVLALVAGQALARRINENDSPSEHSRSKRSLSGKLRQYLDNKLRIMLHEGNETRGIPPFDPFIGDSLNLKLNGEHLIANVEFAEFHVAGLSDYVIDAAEISVIPRKIVIGVTWPRVYSIGIYALEAVAPDLGLGAYGEGEYEVTVIGPTFHTVMTFGIVGPVKIEQMETKLSLDSLDLSVTGLLGDDDTSAFLSDLISDMAPQLLVDYHDEITEMFNKKVMTMVNKKLDGMSLPDIIGRMN